MIYKTGGASKQLNVWWLTVIICFLGLTVSQGAQTNVLFAINKSWKYQQTTNFDSVNWKTIAFDDSSWPSGAALLYSETNSAVSPRNTQLTLGRTTYYFRTQFTFPTNPANLYLTFSNKVDDGAVFYLNGSEIQRVRMPTTSISYSTFATGTPPGGDATAFDVFTIPATNVVQGVNTLAVEVHQNSSTSSDIVFGTALSYGPVGVSRGPYLQMGSPTNVVVRWRTDGATDSRVRYGTNLNNLSSVVNDSTLTTEHELNLIGLSPDTTHFYSVGTSDFTFSGGDTNHFFVTSPVPGTPKPTRIWVLGDAGTKNTNQQAVRNAYYNYTGARHTDTWLMLGDNAYNTGTDAEYQAAVFDMYPEMLRKSVLWSALGNHETAQSTTYTDNYPYFSIFSFPTNGSAGGIASGTEHYYSFDYANIHFVCLDSMTASRATTGAMATWLQADLASTTNTWLIAFWHHPPYTKGSHDSDSETPLIEMRQNFLPILEGGGVDLVLTGHSHAYERSYLLDGHYGISTTITAAMKLNPGSGRTNSSTGSYIKWASGPQSHQGAVYAVAGSSGQISGGSLNHPAMFMSTNVLGSMVLDVDGNTLNAKFVRENGTVVDYFTIEKKDIELSVSSMGGANIQLVATNVAASKTNIVQTSTNLATWNSVSTNSVSSNSFRFTDGRTGDGGKFYRVLRRP